MVKKERPHGLHCAFCCSKGSDIAPAGRGLLRDLSIWHVWSLPANTLANVHAPRNILPCGTFPGFESNWNRPSSVHSYCTNIINDGCVDAFSVFVFLLHLTPDVVLKRLTASLRTKILSQWQSRVFQNKSARDEQQIEDQKRP